MLVLSRKTDESIMLTLDGQTVEVRVLRVEGNKVRLGIVAPAQVTVHRDEIWRRRAELTADAAGLVPTPL